MKKFLATLILALPFASSAFAQTTDVEIATDSVADPYARFRGMSVVDVFNEGAKYQSKRDNVNALECFRYAADQGDKLGQYWTGYIYYHGSAGKIDNDQAIKYFTMASDQGHGKAQFELAALYYGIADYPNAIKYWELAAKSGHPQGLTNIGYCYQEGLGVDCDEEMALNWYMSAAEEGDPTAAYNIGLYHEQGKGGLIPDIEKALEWYTKAWGWGEGKAKDAIDRLQPQQ